MYVKEWRARPGNRERSNLRAQTRWREIGSKERAHRRNVAALYRAWLAQMKSDLGCVDCGERDARCLDFDHVRGVKTHNIAHMTACSRERVLAEIAKCDVRCANCHRKRTAERRIRAAV